MPQQWAGAAAAVLGTGCGWQLERHSKMTVAVVVDEAKRQLVLVVGCT